MGAISTNEIPANSTGYLNAVSDIPEIIQALKRMGLINESDPLLEASNQHVYETLAERLRREGKSGTVTVSRVPGQSRFVRPSEITSITGLSIGTIYRLEKLGMFPKRVLIGLSAVAWELSAVMDWMDSRTSTVKLAVPHGIKRGRPRKIAA
jgi:prophage regulatory protein